MKNDIKIAEGRASKGSPASEWRPPQGTVVTANDRGPNGTIVRAGARGAAGTVVLPIDDEATLPPPKSDPDDATTVVQLHAPRTLVSARTRAWRSEAIVAFAAGSVATALLLLVVILLMRR